MNMCGQKGKKYRTTKIWNFGNDTLGADTTPFVTIEIIKLLVPVICFIGSCFNSYFNSLQFLCTRAF